MMNFGFGYGSTMMGGGSYGLFGALGLITWVIYLVAGALLVVWLWQNITKK